MKIPNKVVAEVGNILIADDDKMCRDSILRVLEKEGHTVHVAEDVDSALLELRTLAFDLIVCDYRMPGKSGVDLLVELRKSGSHTAFLMISAFADTQTTETALHLGAVAVLKKPIRRKELIDQTAMVIRGS